MGRLFTVSLEGMFYTCNFCGTHIALYDDVVSKNWPLHLFNMVVNVIRGELRDRTDTEMLPGMTTSVYCVGCYATIGTTLNGVTQDGENITKWVLHRWKLSFHGPDGEYSPDARVRGTNDGDNA